MSGLLQGGTPIASYLAHLEGNRRMSTKPVTFGKRKTPPAPRGPKRQAPAAAPAEDQRITQRRRTIKRAVIRYNDGLMSCECRVLDISPEGVRLSFADDRPLPHRFTLTIDLDGTEAECALAWYDARQMGAVFIAPPRHVTPSRLQTLQPSEAVHVSTRHVVRRDLLARDGKAPAGLAAELPEAGADRVVRLPVMRRRA